VKINRFIVAQGVRRDAIAGELGARRYDSADGHRRGDLKAGGPEVLHVAARPPGHADRLVRQGVSQDRAVGPAGRRRGQVDLQARQGAGQESDGGQLRLLLPAHLLEPRFDGIFAPTGVALGSNGVTCLAGAAVQGGVAASGSGLAWNVGRNSPIIPTVMARASTDTRVSTTAFTFNANGVTNIAKAAVTAGTTFGALGTIPTGKYGLIAVMISTAGTVTYMSAPANYTTGYAGETDAIGDLANMYPTAGLAFVGYVTIKTASGQPFVVATDALAGGASGNPASVTNYYPIAGMVSGSGLFFQPGFGAQKIANQKGVVLTSVQY
jgi:hypothetical protein